MCKKLYLLVASILIAGLLTACSGNSNSGQAPQNSNTKKEANASNSDLKDGKIDESLMEQDFKVPYTDAINMFKDKYKDADIVDLSLESDLNKYVYTVEGVDDNNEYKMKIDANTKDVLQDKTEKLDSEDLNGKARKEKLDLNDIITPQKAMEIALKEQDGIVKEWSLDKDLDVTFYKIRIDKDKNEYDIKVDSKKGTILEVEKED
ncbi:MULTISPECIES: PepSY domain-containing protein [unclassified Clostridioides]|uniref:PepSY domain-containing protein n=1 Tax=unclassified Clostridioides TaxID=2635829 RepID=UPI001D0CA899|nr:PepSY domain-containing protein [Clostridioides sp. ES-S-0049-03]MCC0652148.1 PepSY domain-containing protein [Clostridioides sp. ES-S-0001-03]MCC0655515.1 PepSY domain-containing protein [Clostridioides sp. ES-S-0123-01]MCC0670643.1 PepSY domain-containing protein [Clostridioides sp. ES-S-0145-01]MCC0674701.1 PepSY domain-containing protein [Clostridioides sp. ES-W-0018-02]MCC0679230.1 PepSY domain-containing protein [Clostridioides sp. ES-S-0005-03]MCC0696862.1 PepSY domain-containing pr